MDNLVYTVTAQTDVGDQLAIITIIAVMLTVIFILARLKILMKLLIIFFAFAVFYAVMTVVPALRVPVLYDLMKQFFVELPDWIGGLLETFKRMMGGLPT